MAVSIGILGCVDGSLIHIDTIATVRKDIRPFPNPMPKTLPFAIRPSWSGNELKIQGPKDRDCCMRVILGIRGTFFKSVVVGKLTLMAEGTRNREGDGLVPQCLSWAAALALVVSVQ